MRGPLCILHVHCELGDQTHEKQFRTAHHNKQASVAAARRGARSRRCPVEEWSAVCSVRTLPSTCASPWKSPPIRVQALPCSLPLPSLTLRLVYPETTLLGYRPPGRWTERRLWCRSPPRIPRARPPAVGCAQPAVVSAPSHAPSKSHLCSHCRIPPRNPRCTVRTQRPVAGLLPLCCLGRATPTRARYLAA